MKLMVLMESHIRPLGEFINVDEVSPLVAILIAVVPGRRKESQ
jgi:hypothetical protein